MKLPLCGGHCSGEKKVNITVEKCSDEKLQKKKAYTYQITTILSGYIFMIGFGTQLSWTSPALPYLRSEESGFHLSLNQTGWIASLQTISEIIGFLLFFIFMNRIGRRYIFLIFGGIQFLSWILIIFAYNFTFLCISRICVGISLAGMICIISVYIGEVSGKNIRGTLIIIARIFANFGSFLINTAGAFLTYEVMNIVMILIPLLAFCLFPFMTETPHYHLIQGRDNEAIKTLMNLSGVDKSEIVMCDIKRMKEEMSNNRNLKGYGIRELFSNRGNRKALIIIIIAEATLELSGFYAIHAYAQEILSYSGSTLSPAYEAMILSGIQIFSGLPSTYIIDHWGRKPIYLLSGMMSSLLLGLVGLFFYFKIVIGTNFSSFTWLPLVGLILYMCMVNIGIIIIPKIYLGELFSVEVKGVAALLSKSIGSFILFMIKNWLPIINEKAGIYTTFWIFSIGCFTGTLIVFILVPETKGKNLEEILVIFRSESRKSQTVNITRMNI